MGFPVPVGTRSPQKGRVLIEPRNQREFDRIKGALKGAWVLIETGPTNGLGLDFNYRDIWHTEDDLFDKLVPAYLEHSAVIQAVTAYGLANLDHLLSREGLYKE